MHKIFKSLILIFLLTFLYTVEVQAENITDINTLIEAAKEFDGKEVIVQGEAIGEPMDRGDYSWVNINDGTNAIGIWLKNSEAEQILHYGNYKYKGDTIKITGTFNRACKEHGGEADIHNTAITIEEQGYKVERQLSSVKLIFAIVLIVASFILIMCLGKFIKTNKKLAY